MNSRHACQPAVVLFRVPHVICLWYENLTLRLVILQNFRNLALEQQLACVGDWPIWEPDLEEATGWTTKYDFMLRTDPPLLVIAVGTVREVTWFGTEKKTAEILSYIQLVDISLRHNGESSISHLNRPSYRRNLYPSDGTILTTELPSLKSIAAWKRHNIHTWLDSIHSHKLSPVIGLNGRVNGSNLSNSYFSLWRVENIATCRLGIYLFGFLDNIASSADFVASYDRIISEYEIGKEMWRRGDLIWGSPHSHRWGQEVEENNQKI